VKGRGMGSRVAVAKYYSGNKRTTGESKQVCPGRDLAPMIWKKKGDSYEKTGRKVKKRNLSGGGKKASRKKKTRPQEAAMI